MRLNRLSTAAVIAGVLMLMAVFPLLAHEGREVGEYVIEVGWREEPAFVGLVNGPEVFITRHETGEPVLGLEATLQLEIQFGDQTRLLLLQPVFEQPGRYTADVLPTRPGDYLFRLTGAINETPVDEVFSAAEGQFATVDPINDIAFPETGGDEDTQGRLDMLQAQIDELRAQVEALQIE